MALTPELVCVGLQPLDLVQKENKEPFVAQACMPLGEMNDNELYKLGVLTCFGPTDIISDKKNLARESTSLNREWS